MANSIFLVISFTMILLSCILVTSPNYAKAQDGSLIYDLDDSINNKTYVEESTNWWNWALSFNVDENPREKKGDEITEENCGLHQNSNDTLYLTDELTRVDNETKVITCAIPHGKSIWLQILGSMCTVLENQELLMTEKGLKDCASWVFAEYPPTNVKSSSHVDGIRDTEKECMEEANKKNSLDKLDKYMLTNNIEIAAFLDGVKVIDIKRNSPIEIKQEYFINPTWTCFLVPEDNPYFPWATGTHYYVGLIAGYFMGIKPLPLGSHTIDIFATAFGNNAAQLGEVKIHYNLLIK